MENTNKDDKKDSIRIKKKHVKIALAVLAVAVLLFVFWAIMEKNAAKSQQQSAEMAMASANNARGHHKHGKHAREYEVKFLDSLDVNKVRMVRAGGNNGDGNRHWAGNGAPNPNAGNPPEPSAVNNRMGAAYRLGMAFASVDDDAAAQRERLLGMVVPSVERNNADSLEQFFYDCVSRAESDGENGIAALMMSGYYFGSLSTVLEYVDEETQLPDEKTLAAGIKKMDNLREYLNNAITAEKEVKIAMTIQRLEVAADSVQATYYNCQADYGENGPKYDKLLSSIKTVEDVFK